MKIETAFFEGAAGTASQLPASDLPEVAFSGRSNVGKSSLINKLLNRKALARTSASPGKTVTVNFYRLEGARLVDLPGYGYAKVSRGEKLRWSELVEGYFAMERDLRLVIQLIDMRHPPTEDDLSMLHFLMERSTPFLVALTKSDKLNATQRAERLKGLETELGFLRGIPVLPFSAVKGEGAEEIRRLIDARLDG